MNSYLVSELKQEGLTFCLSNIPWSCPETHTKRQATQRGCLPSFLGDDNKGTEIVYGEKNIFCTGPTRAAKAEQKSLVPALQPNEPTKKGPPPFVLSEPLSPQFQQLGRATPL